MTIEVVGVSKHVPVGTSSSLTLPVPTDVNGVVVQEGDLLLFAYVVTNDAAHIATNFNTALTLPDGWSPLGYSSTGSFNFIIWSFKFVDDGDPVIYTFDYLSSVNMIGVMVGLRGAPRDYNPFTPIYADSQFTAAPSAGYLAGYFSPSGSGPSVNIGTSTTLSANHGTNPRVFRDASVVVYLAVMFRIANATPAKFDDPVPLVPIADAFTFSGTDSMTLRVIAQESDIAAPPTNFTIVADTNLFWMVSAISVEAYDVNAASEDNYKGKVMRGMLKDPWDTSWGSGLSDVLTIIGSSDNDIGGLFGEDDFLPNGDEE